MRKTCPLILLLIFLGSARDRGKATVEISNMAFSPVELTITTGQTVVWTNNDDRDHTVVARDGSFQSPKLGQGEIFEHLFKKVGRFPYSCSFHPRMKGAVIVRDAEKD